MGVLRLRAFATLSAFGRTTVFHDSYMTATSQQNSSMCSLNGYEVRPKYRCRLSKVSRCKWKEKDKLVYSNPDNYRQLVKLYKLLGGLFKKQNSNKAQMHSERFFVVFQELKESLRLTKTGLWSLARTPSSNKDVFTSYAFTVLLI